MLYIIKMALINPIFKYHLIKSGLEYSYAAILQFDSIVENIETNIDHK